MADVLSAKERAFVQEYMVDLNAAAAARRAGYSENSAKVLGYQLLQRPRVQAAVTEASVKRATDNELDEKWVLDRLKLISDRCVQGVPVLDSEGNLTGEWRFDSNGANKATELIGKHRAMFRDKVDLTVRRSHEEALEELI